MNDWHRNEIIITSDILICIGINQWESVKSICMVFSNLKLSKINI